MQGRWCSIGILFVIFFPWQVANGGLVDTKAPNFELTDIKGRKASLAQFKGRILILGLADRKTGKLVKPWQIELGFRFRKSPGVVSAIILDLHGVPRGFRSFARESVLKGVEDSVEKIVELYEQAGETPPQNLADLFFVVPDWKGGVAKSFRLKEAMDKPHLFIIDGQGMIRGHFTANTEENNSKIIGLIERLLVSSREVPEGE